MRQRAVADPVSDGLAELARLETRLAAEVAAARESAAFEVSAAQRAAEAEERGRRG